MNQSESKNKKTGRIGIMVILVLLFLLLGIYTTHRGGIGANDLRVYYKPVQSHLNGKSIYPGLYFYPPVIVALFTPIASGSMYVTAGIWYVLNVIFLLLTVKLCVKLSSDGKPPGKLLYIVPILYSLGFSVGSLMMGQINILILLLVCSAFYLVRMKKEVLAGVFLGIAIVLKLTPLLVLVYFVFKKKFRILKGVFISAVILIVVLPTLFFGVKKNIEYQKAWVERSFLPNVTGKDFAEGNFHRYGNQSLEAMLIRFFTDVPYMLADDKYTKISNVYIVPLKKDVVLWITKILCLVILGILFLLFKSKEGDYMHLNFEYSLITMSMIIMSPLSWSHHFVMLLFPATIATKYIVDRTKDISRRKLLKVCMIISFILFVCSLIHYVKALSSILIGTLILFAGMALVLKKEGIK